MEEWVMPPQYRIAARSAYKDRVDILFHKGTAASNPIDYDFAGKTILVRLYIFEEDVNIPESYISSSGK